MTTWAAPITAITLFVGDLAAARAFYTRVFDLPVHYEDDVSCVFDFGNTLVNLLLSTEAGELIEPAIPGVDGAGPRMQLTITVDDVDAACARVTEARCDPAQRAAGSAVGRPDGVLRRPGRSHLGDRQVAARLHLHRGHELEVVAVGVLEGRDDASG